MCKKTFDVVVVLGKCIPERALATKQTLHWPEVASQPSLLETKDVIDKRVRELLATLWKKNWKWKVDFEKIEKRLFGFLSKTSFEEGWLHSISHFVENARKLCIVVVIIPAGNGSDCGRTPSDCLRTARTAAEIVAGNFDLSWTACVEASQTFAKRAGGDVEKKKEENARVHQGTCNLWWQRDEEILQFPLSKA